MWLAIIILAISTSTRGEQYKEAPFHKCCDDGQNLLKVNDEFSKYFRCVPTNYTGQPSDVTASLIVSNAVKIEYGLPECDDLVVIEAGDIRGSYCSDLLMMEERNDTVEHIIPQVVFLSCASETKLKSFVYTIAALRKCCPQGQSYDAKNHICKESPTSTGAWLTDKIGDSDLYEMEVGLYCKPDEYQIEMLDSVFDLRVEGSSLVARRRSDGHSLRFAKGEWCAEQGAERGLVARGCSRRCRDLGALCLRKCCPIGHHYRPRRCGGLASTCVPNEDYDTAFNITHYLNEMRDHHEDIPEVTGIRSHLACPAGKFGLSRSDPDDAHGLSLAGLVVPAARAAPTDDYCLEAFDQRPCGGPVLITALMCFVPPTLPKKDFTISFVALCISCVCLALTLAVYLALPELRNLHGKTLMCHVATMLLAYCCLARVQYGRVVDKRLCKLLGYGIYFGFVSAFAWLNVMCLDIWWTFGSVRTVQGLRKASAERRRFAWYSLYAWSAGGGLTLLMLLLELYPLAPALTADIGRGACWFSDFNGSDWPHYIFFVIPMGAVTCVDFVLWALTARHCHRVRSEVRRLQAGSTGDRLRKRFRDDRARYALTGKLWVVMGAGWVWELLSTLVQEPRWLWAAVDLCNELQGVFIFLILVLKPKLYFLIRKRLGLEQRDAKRDTTSRTTSTLLSRSVSADDARRVHAADKAKK